MNRFRSELLCLLLVVCLAGCGGGGSGGEGGVGGAPAPVATFCHDPQTICTSGLFLDSPVQGITRQSGTLPADQTGENGRFSYAPGEPITFSIGGIELGTLPVGERIITPSDFGASAEINIARFLQTLDADGDPSNGIDLTEAAVALAGTDSTFDVAELAGQTFAVGFYGESGGDIGIVDFAPLADPADSGSTVVTMFSSDTLADGGDGTINVEPWSVDVDGVLTVIAPLDLDTATIQKAGASARAISVVGTVDSKEIVGTLQEPVTVTVADLAGASGKAYNVTVFIFDESVVRSLFTFFPDGTLTVDENGVVSNKTWEIDSKGVLVTVLNPADQDVRMFVLVNGSFATGGDILHVNATNLSGNPTAPVLQLDRLHQGTFAPAL